MDLTNKSVFENKFFIALELIFILILLLVISWATGLITICGDNYCFPAECFNGCRDCRPKLCQDGNCQIELHENCNNSLDCSCGSGFVCAPSRENLDSKGCYETKCGDKYCDETEKNNICCIDCGCTKGYKCISETNECQFLSPKVEINFTSVSRDISSSTLYSNPRLVDDTKISHPFAKLKIVNNGPNTAKNVKLHIRISSYSEDTIVDLYDLSSYQEKNYDWYPVFTKDVLDIKEDIRVYIYAKVKYEDENGKEYMTEKTYDRKIIGRSKWGEYSSFSQFVTPLDDTVRQTVSMAGSFDTSKDKGINDAAEAIWDLLGNIGIEYISDPNFEYIQYPAEVLKNKKGDCDDLAILYVSLLESIGIKTALISIPGHMYAGYYDSKYIYPIETTLIGHPFAVSSMAGLEQYNKNNSKSIINIKEELDKKDIAVPSNVGINSVDLEYAIISAKIANQEANSDCIDYAYWGPCISVRNTITCEVLFENSGTKDGYKCVTVETYKDDEMIKTQNICAQVPAQSFKMQRVIYTGEEPTYSSYIHFEYGCRIK